MKIDIIGFENANVTRLQSYLQSRHHSVRVILAEKLYIDLTTGGGPVVVPYDTLDLPDVFVSATSTDTVTALAALQVLEESGLAVVNRAGPIKTSADKFAAALAFQKAGIPHPRVIQVGTLAAAHEAAVRLGYPLVLKAPDGAEGNSVKLVSQASELPDAIAQIRRVCGLAADVRAPILVQQLITGSIGHDKRVFVVGGVAVAGMERVAQPGEWRSNLSQGAHPRPANLSAEEADLAVRSLAALDLDFGVVDVMTTSDGPLVIEVNCGGDIVDIIAMSGVDLISVLVRFIEAKGGGDSWEPATQLRILPRLDDKQLASEVEFAWDRIARKAVELAQRAAG